MGGSAGATCPHQPSRSVRRSQFAYESDSNVGANLKVTGVAAIMPLANPVYHEPCAVAMWNTTIGPILNNLPCDTVIVAHRFAALLAAVEAAAAAATPAELDTLQRPQWDTGDPV